MREEKKVIVFKSRQVGISWVLALYAAWLLTFFDSTKVLELSQKEDDAYDLLGKTKFILNHHPDFLRCKLDPDQSGLVGIPATDGVIKALPSTHNAGRSTDATLVICDEWEYHPYAEANFAAIKPTIDAGGQFIGVSTIDRLNINSFPKTIWREAKSGKNTFEPRFYGWRVVPTRTEAWFKEVSRDMPEWMRAGEYPEDEVEAMSPLKTIGFFDNDVLDAMFKDVVYESIRTTIINTRGGIVNIYKLPVVGKRYCVFTDPSDGKDDPCHIVVMDWTTGEGVCEVSGKVTADVCAQIHDELVRLYNKAFNSYEINSSAGAKFQETIKNVETPNQCWFVKADDSLDKNKKGWYTSPQMKKKMIWGLEEAVRKRLITVHRRETLEQFKGFIIPQGEDPQIIKGMHDDAIIAWAGVWQIRKFMPNAGFIKIHSYTYKEG